MVFENENNSLKGIFENDEFIQGEYKDSLGNKFMSKVSTDPKFKNG
jgi:hypothetical protein